MRIACALIVAVLATPHRVDAQSVTATITYPADGAVQADLSQPIQWTTVANVQAYYLYVGTTVGAYDLVNTGELQVTSALAPELPLGPTLYARIWTKVAGVWRYVDSTFTARASAPVTAVITYPADGAANADVAQPIQWTSIANAQAYYLYMGTTLGAKDLVNTGELQQTSYLPAGLPAGQTLYARLWTKVADVWRYVDSTFSVSVFLVSTSTITYPANGAVNADLSIPIQWTDVWIRQRYYLYLGTTVGAKDVVDSGETLSSFYRAGAVPVGETLYARLWTKAGGIWRYTDSSFSAGARTSQDVTITFDGLGLAPAPVTTYAESGFTVSATEGSWVDQPSYGFPAPFISFGTGSSTAVGQVQVVAAGQVTFGFKSVDLYSSTTPIPYTITGLRNSAPVFAVTGTVPQTFGNFKTVVNPHATDVIDALIISLTNPAFPYRLNPVGLDNISLSP